MLRPLSSGPGRPSPGRGASSSPSQPLLQDGRHFSGYEERPMRTSIDLTLQLVRFTNPTVIHLSTPISASRCTGLHPPTGRSLNPVSDELDDALAPPLWRHAGSCLADVD